MRPVDAIGILIALVLILPVPRCFAMEVSFEQDAAEPAKSQSIRLSGTIGPLEAEQLKTWIRADPVFAEHRLDTIYLSSPGGDVAGAIGLFILIQQLASRVIVDGDCSSACAILFGAAPVRTVAGVGRIGLHRPYPTETIHGLEKSQQNNIDVGIQKVLHALFAAGGFSERLFEKLWATDPDGMYWMTESDLAELGARSPEEKRELELECPEQMNGSNGLVCEDALRAKRRKIFIEGLR